MLAIIERTYRGSLQDYIADGLKVDGTSKDWRRATKNVDSIQDLVDIIEQSKTDVVVGYSDGRLSVEIYDDYRE